MKKKTYIVLAGLLLLNYVAMHDVSWASGKRDKTTESSLSPQDVSIYPVLNDYFTHASQFTDTSRIETVTGSVMLILIRTQDAQHQYTVALSDPSQEDPSQESIITVPVLEFTPAQWYALLPIPYHLKSDTYTVSVMDAQQEVRTRISLWVNARRYNTEKVALNRNLANRKSQPPDPTVVKEANEIWDLTGQVNSEMHKFENFIFPVKSYKYITGMYSDKRDYVYLDGTHITRGIHGGVDIAAPIGTPVYAAGKGKVVLAKFRIVTGNSIVLEHFPGLFTMYYHLNTIDVEVGDIVEQEMQIGTVGSTGFSTGAHLHWETRVNNIRIDPLLLLDIIDKIRTLDI